MRNSLISSAEMSFPELQAHEFDSGRIMEEKEGRHRMAAGHPNPVRSFVIRMV